MAKTLVQFATDRRDVIAQRKQAAFAEFDATRRELDGPPDPGLRKTLEMRSGDLAKRNREIAEVRRALAGELTPAELEAQVEALRALIAQRRGLRFDLLDDEEAAALAEGELERARVAHQAAGAALAGAETRLVEETARAERLRKWNDSLAEEPLTSLQSRAKQARTKAPDNEAFKKAKKRVEDAIPKKLRDRALERYDQELERLAAARRAVEDAEETLAEGSVETAGPTAAVASARVELARAEAALADFVVRGPERLEMALGLLARVADGPKPTGAEAAAVTAEDLVTAGEAAVAAEKARDEARSALAAAEEALEAKRLELKAADIDADPDADPAVTPLQKQVDQAEDALTDAEDAYTEEMRADLDAWEAAVPDGLWADLLSFERARRILDALEKTKPDALAAKIATDEEALVDALTAEARTLRKVDFLRAQAERRKERLHVTETIQDRRAAAAVRGDR